MATIDFQVLHYLKALKKFLYGDLAEFEKLANLKEKEEKELIQSSQKVELPITSSNNPTSTPTTIPQTPYPPTTAPPPFQTPNQTEFSNSGPTQIGELEITKIDQTFFRSTIPHSLVVLATMDLLGALLRSGDIFNESGNNMKEFLSPYNFNEDQLKLLIKFYRHGMAHSFFPKHRFGISYHSSNELKGLYFEEKGIISLNVNLLIRIMKERLEKIMDTETLHAGMEKQFELLVSLDKKYLEKNIDLTKIF